MQSAGNKECYLLPLSVSYYTDFFDNIFYTSAKMAEYLASIFGTEKDKYVTADHFYVCIIDRPDKDANLYNTLVNVF